MQPLPPTRVDTHTKQMHTIKQKQDIKQVHTYTPDDNPEFRYVPVSEYSSQHCQHKVFNIFQPLKQYIRDGIRRPATATLVATSHLYITTNINLHQMVMCSYHFLQFSRGNETLIRLTMDSTTDGVVLIWKHIIVISSLSEFMSVALTSTSLM